MLSLEVREIPECVTVANKNKDIAQKQKLTITKKTM